MDIQASEAESKFALIHTTLGNLVFNIIGSYEKTLEDYRTTIKSFTEQNKKLKDDNDRLIAEKKKVESSFND